MCDFFKTYITDADFYDKYKNIMEINIDSVVLLTHLSVKHLEKTKGNVINISNTAGLKSVSFETKPLTLILDTCWERYSMFCLVEFSHEYFQFLINNLK